MLMRFDPFRELAFRELDRMSLAWIATRSRSPRR
jgi:hypothetical protein